jgi:hypothetical protein
MRGKQRRALKEFVKPLPDSLKRLPAPLELLRVYARDAEIREYFKKDVAPLVA